MDDNTKMSLSCLSCICYFKVIHKLILKKQFEILENNVMQIMHHISKSENKKSGKKLISLRYHLLNIEIFNEILNEHVLQDSIVQKVNESNYEVTKKFHISWNKQLQQIWNVNGNTFDYYIYLKMMSNVPNQQNIKNNPITPKLSSWLCIPVIIN